MQSRLGIIGGAIGGIIMLLVDQISYSIGISSVDTIGEFSRIFKLFGGSKSIISSWILYITITGLIGWLVASILADAKKHSFVIYGAIIGVLLWLAMNIIFTDSQIGMPTWSMGVGSFIISLISHIVLGLSITYPIMRFGIKDKNMYESQ